MKWGLESSSNPASSSLSTFNCRVESLARPTGLWAPFRQNGHRCIVFIEGYYEWLKRPNGGKTPYYVKPRSGKLLCLAGLWNKTVKGGKGGSGNNEGSEQGLYTFTVLTQPASADLKWLHERMPLILKDAESIQRWIDPAQKWSPDLLKESKVVETKEELEWYEVDPEVGKVKNNYAKLNQPYERKTIDEFFGGAMRKKDEPKRDHEIKIENMLSSEIKSDDDLWQDDNRNLEKHKKRKVEESMEQPKEQLKEEAKGQLKEEAKEPLKEQHGHEDDKQSKVTNDRNEEREEEREEKEVWQDYRDFDEYKHLKTSGNQTSSTDSPIHLAGPEGSPSAKRSAIMEPDVKSTHSKKQRSAGTDIKGNKKITAFFSAKPRQH